MKRIPVSEKERGRWQAVAAMLGPFARRPQALPLPEVASAAPPLEAQEVSSAAPALEVEQPGRPPVDVVSAAEAVLAAAAVQAAEETPVAEAPAAAHAPTMLPSLADYIRRDPPPDAVAPPPAMEAAPVEICQAAGAFFATIAWQARGSRVPTPRIRVEPAPGPPDMRIPARAWLSTRVSWDGRRGAPAVEPPLVAFMAMATGQALKTATRRGSETRPPAASRFFRSIQWSRRGIEA